MTSTPEDFANIYDLLNEVNGVGTSHIQEIIQHHVQVLQIEENLQLWGMNQRAVNNLVIYESHSYANNANYDYDAYPGILTNYILEDLYI